LILCNRRGNRESHASMSAETWAYNDLARGSLCRKVPSHANAVPKGKRAQARTKKTAHLHARGQAQTGRGGRRGCCRSSLSVGCHWVRAGSFAGEEPPGQQAHHLSSLRPSEDQGATCPGSSEQKEAVPEIQDVAQGEAPRWGMVQRPPMSVMRWVYTLRATAWREAWPGRQRTLGCQTVQPNQGYSTSCLRAARSGRPR